MKKADLIFVIYFTALFLPFFLSQNLYHYYSEINNNHPVLTSFIKFALLATTGELIGLRIKTGSYFKRGFGIFPRALVWGLLGVTVKIAFTVFSNGTPVFMEVAGIHGAVDYFHGPLCGMKIFIAFCVSTCLNIFYAPVLMTFHKITDTHIVQHEGALSCLIRPIRFREILVNMDWDVQWNFVFKRTIPLFWIPAQTITFLLPVRFQILFAALLGIVLGVLMAVAGVSGKKSNQV
jgi:hypothetical protein